MLCLHFLIGDCVWFDGEIEEKERMDTVIREHLGVTDTVRYIIHRIVDEEDPKLIHVWVEDRVISTNYDNANHFPRSVSEERPRRTVWVNPPTEESGDEKRPYPWNTHYTEYFQVFYNGFEQNGVYNIYTVKYWERIDDLEMYDPTELAVARKEHLQSLAQE